MSINSSFLWNRTSQTVLQEIRLNKYSFVPDSQNHTVLLAASTTHYWKSASSSLHLQFWKKITQKLKQKHLLNTTPSNRAQDPPPFELWSGNFHSSRDRFLQVGYNFRGKKETEEICWLLLQRKRNSSRYHKAFRGGQEAHPTQPSSCSSIDPSEKLGTPWRETVLYRLCLELHFTWHGELSKNPPPSLPQMKFQLQKCFMLPMTPPVSRLLKICMLPVAHTKKPRNEHQYYWKRARSKFLPTLHKGQACL